MFREHNDGADATEQDEPFCDAVITKKQKTFAGWRSGESDDWNEVNIAF